MNPLEPQLEQIVRELVEAYFPFTLERMASRPDSRPEEDILVASVDLCSKAQGTLRLSCPMPLARRLGAVMFGRPDSPLAPDEVSDAWKELANIVGGNLKALLEPPATMNPPRTECVPGPLAPPSQESSRTLCDLAFGIDQEWLTISFQEARGA